MPLDLNKFFDNFQQFIFFKSRKRNSFTRPQKSFDILIRSEQKNVVLIISECFHTFETSIGIMESGIEWMKIEKEHGFDHRILPACFFIINNFTDMIGNHFTKFKVKIFILHWCWNWSQFYFNILSFESLKFLRTKFL